MATNAASRHHPLYRHTLDNGELIRRSRHNTREPEPARLEQACELLLGPLAATGHHQHIQVGELGQWAIVRRADDLFHKKQLTACGNRSPAVA